MSEAAAALGVSAPTVKRMVAESRLEAYRTPGRHLRILAESVEAMREGKHGQPRQVRDASPVLQNRRERLEELTLEAQEHRARRELTKLEREEQKEAESREAEARAREEEAAQHQAEIEFERERLEHEKALERRGLERERAQEQARLDAQEELADFRQRWYDAAAVATPKLAWLTPGQRKEVTEALEAEIERRQPADEPRMGAIIARSLEALIEPLRAERDAQERRQKVTNEALWSLPHSATEAEKVNATAAIREALGRLDGSADVSEMRVAAQEAVRSIRQAVERRLLDARLLHWAIWQLPWGRTDRDEARIRRECAEILAEMPIDISEADGKEALESTVQEAGRGIELRQAEKQRQVRKASLVQQGVDEVSGYLWKLKNADEISADDYWDTDFNTDLKKAVQRGLDDELTGEETVSKVRELTRAIIDDALEG